MNRRGPNTLLCGTPDNDVKHHCQDVKQAIGRRQRAYETKRRTNDEETVAEYIEAKRQVKRIVKQEKRNKN